MRRILGEKGTGLIEVLMLISVTAIGAAAIASLTAQALKATSRGMDKQQFFRISQNIQSTLLSDKYWRQTLMVGNSFACIRSTTAPTNDCCVNSAPSPCNPGIKTGNVSTRDPNYNGPSFSLYDSDSNIIQPDTLASQFKTSGYNNAGQVCTGFDNKNGNDACPLQLTLRWEANDCTHSPCVEPEIRIIGTFVYAPKTTARSLLNTSLLNFVVARPPLKPLVQAGSCYNITCTSLSNATKTLTANTTTDNITVAEAPSLLGAWVIEFTNLGTVKTAYNCFDDNQGATPHSYNAVGNCKTYAGTLGTGETYAYGMANPFKSCQTPVACP